MNRRRSGVFLTALLTVALPLVLPGCSGGTAGSSAGVRIGCGSGDVQGLCVTRCNLGCSVTGCNITEIAVNQPLSFDFNLNINPDTVNSNTFKLRTATGNEPVGSFLVQGQTVFFFPEAKVVGQKTFFGFDSGATYTLTIPSGTDALDTIESMSGDKVAATFSCRLNVSRGIVDFDGKPPTASLLLPSSTSVCVKGETLILVEFSEIVDAATLLGSAKTAGVLFGLAQFDAQGNCSVNDLAISGARTVSVNKATQRTRLLFRPSFVLPGGFCVRIRITDKVRDLSGKRAKAITFEFKTCATSGVDKVIVEDFSDPKKTRDDARNGAKWAKGRVVPAFVGGGGRLGDFNVRFGQDTSDPRSGRDKDPDGNTFYYWNTDRSVIPAIRTLSGKAITVDNGVYEFTSFELKEGEHLRFTGSHPPLIRVTGSLSIRGILSQAGSDAFKRKSPTPGKPPFDGEKGYAGGVGGGAGGNGGDSPHRTPPGTIHGGDGENIKVPAGHPLESLVANTGGKGSRANPESGLDKDACFTAYQASISQQGAAGGGGGGFVTAGGNGSCVDNKTGFSGHPPQSCDFGKPSQGGKAVSLASLFSRTEKSSFLYLIGGSGGGGGGAHTHGAFDERPTKPVTFSPGGGGVGGGGTLQLQIGGDLVVGNRARITVKGGAALDYPYDVNDFWNLAPGGAGAGGSLLMQIGGVPDIRGVVRATGGGAGRLNSKPNFDLRLDSLSGAGGDGFIRIEANPRIDHRQFGTFQPAAKAENSALLREVDYTEESLLATRFYDTKLFFPPKYIRYEIDALINNNPVRYSDDSSKGIPADDNAPVTLLIQSAQLDPDTKLPDPETFSPWYVGAVDGLNRAGGNGFRYMLRFNTSKTAAPAAATSMVIKEVRVHFRG